MYKLKHMGKVVIKILQVSAVTLTMLGGLTIHPPVANFLQCKCAKNYENWLAVDKVNYCKNYQAYFFWSTLYMASGRYRAALPSAQQSASAGASSSNCPLVLPKVNVM